MLQLDPLLYCWPNGTAAQGKAVILFLQHLNMAVVARTNAMLMQAYLYQAYRGAP